MAQKSPEKSKKSSCCRLKLPKLPVSWLLFFDFAFTFGTCVVYFADIVTDVITLRTYFLAKWYHAFGLSIGFIVLPSVILAILEFQFLIKTYAKNIKWSVVILRTLLNIPFQLTVIWYHIKLSYSYLCLWINHVQKQPGSDNTRIRTDARQNSMSNLADLDERSNTIERKALASVEIPAPSESMQQAQTPSQNDHNWWKQLTREQWLAHLNKMKLSESMLESLPQLLINLYLIVKYPDTHIIQYLSAVVSYISLCGGVVRYDKTRKDNEAERLMVDRTLLHSRVFTTRLEIPQIFFLSLYKGFYLAARILAFVYFTVYYTWNVLIVILLHWAGVMCYLVYLWYPKDINKVTRNLIQADYKYRAYMFLSQDFLSVFHNSLMGIFIHIRPYTYAFLGQPYCFIFWFYLIYVVENIVLFLLPGVLLSLANREADLIRYQYYMVLIFELTLNVLGCVLCILYYFTIHKTSIYTRNAYPIVSRVQYLCCSGLGPNINKKWTVCKQAETSEVFFLQRDALKQFKNNYTTVVRINKKKGRTLECFLDERGKIFYAPRRKLFKRISTDEGEAKAELTREQSCESLDALDSKAPLCPQDISSSVREVEVDVAIGQNFVLSVPVAHENAEAQNVVQTTESVSEVSETNRRLISTSTEQGKDQKQKTSQRSANTDVSGASDNDLPLSDLQSHSKFSRSPKDPNSRSSTSISKKPILNRNTNASPQDRASENIETKKKLLVKERSVGERPNDSDRDSRPQSTKQKGQKASLSGHSHASHSESSRHSGNRRQSPCSQRSDPRSRSGGSQAQTRESPEDRARLLQNKSSRHEKKESRKSTSPSSGEKNARDGESPKRSNRSKSSQQSHRSRSDQPVGQTWI